MSKIVAVLSLLTVTLVAVPSARAQSDMPSWGIEAETEANTDDGASADVDAADPEAGLDPEGGDTDWEDDEPEAVPALAEVEDAEAEQAEQAPMADLPAGDTGTANLLIKGGAAVIGLGVIGAVALYVLIDAGAAGALTMIGGVAVGGGLLGIGLHQRNDALHSTDQKPDPRTGPAGLPTGVTLRMKFAY